MGREGEGGNEKERDGEVLLHHFQYVNGCQRLRIRTAVSAKHTVSSGIPVESF